MDDRDYGVSIHLMLLFIKRREWNTLSCTRVSIHLMLLFIRKGHYIRSKCRHVSIHLMLLFISKTSWIWAYAIYVSIHLMLLFIGNWKTSKGWLCTFQYISCYSLSVIREKRAWMAPVSIHLMLLFIRDKIKISFDGRLVSIHLMLLFICAAATKLKDWVVFQYISCYSLSGTSTHKTVRIPRFNTSHVTLYRRCLLERKQD